MVCSPTLLYMDMLLWITSVDTYTNYVERSVNRSVNKIPDCALMSVPCGSVIAKQAFSFDSTTVFWFDHLVVYILSGLVFVAGFLGNVFNMVIFSKNRIATDSTNSLLLGLSVTDFLTVFVNGLILACFFVCMNDYAAAYTALNHVWSYGWIAMRHLNLLSLDFVTFIAIQRAAAVLLPFKVAIMFSQGKTNIIVAGLVLLCVCGIVTSNAGFYPSWVYHLYFNESVSLGAAHRWPSHLIVKYLTLYLDTRSIINLILIFGSGMLTVFKLRMQAQTRASLKAVKSSANDTNVASMSSTEMKVVKMLLTVCAVSFVIYTCGILANSVIQMFARELFRTTLPFMSMYSIVILLSMNCSLNFFLYMLMSEKFRGHFKRYFIRVVNTTKF